MRLNLAQSPLWQRLVYLIIFRNIENYIIYNNISPLTLLSTPYDSKYLLLCSIEHNIQCHIENRPMNHKSVCTLVSKINADNFSLPIKLAFSNFFLIHSNTLLNKRICFTNMSDLRHR